MPALGRAGDEDLADGVVGVSAAEGVQAVLALHEAVVHAEGCKSVGGLGRDWESVVDSGRTDQTQRYCLCHTKCSKYDQNKQSEVSLSVRSASLLRDFALCSAGTERLDRRALDICALV